VNAPRRLTGPRALATAACWLALSCLLTGGARAAEVPLWELGVGAGAVVFRDYRGADQSHVYPLPVVYLSYQGRFLKSDREGVRGLFFSNRFAELNVSINATTPVRSRDNDARAGMPDLKPTFEIGPSLDLHLWRSTEHRLKLDLQLPLRRAITIEREPHAIGWFFAPRLNLDWRDPLGFEGWNAGVLAGPLYGDRAYHSYFYGVAPGFVTPERPGYRATGGYSGTESIAALSRRFPTWWLGVFVRYDSLAGATFDPSPLVRSRSYWAGGFGVAWMVGRSTRLVETRDER
jgi:outer membrane scaffolding protein for murein synthesis (MipA/OmpV family)